ncbi:MAG: hypothetical protein BGP16_14355 [Sphingobium sp. 66-54]|nr:MAG: hypothetical protein BGP16_14355 [Sphingobium sp. 66-54]
MVESNMRRAALPRGGRQRERTRNAILAAGQQLFATRALESVTIDEIVEVADVAKGSFYNHFNGKEGLAQAVLEMVRGDCEFRVFAANRDVSHPPLRLVRAMCVVIRYAMEHPERLQSLLGLSERHTAYNSTFNVGINADLNQGLEDGSFSGMDIEAGVLVVIGLITIAVRHVMAPETETAPATIAVSLGAALLRSLGVSAADAAATAATAAEAILHSEPAR